MKTCPTCHGNYSGGFAHCPRDGTPLVEADLWTEGMVVRGKYKILSKIGQGAMGAVYKAVHLRFKELRALKVMIPEMMRHPVLLKRFEHEAMVTRKLQHPNAVRVEDFDEGEDGRPFIVMEYVEGRSLEQVIARQGRLPVAGACAIAKQIASALDAAHRIGIIHRDIKPSNIVLVERSLSDPVGPNDAPAEPGGDATEALNPAITESPEDPMAQSPDHPIAKVLDFGIAKIKEGLLETTDAGRALTRAGAPIGTPYYMSPEQAMAKRGQELDGRSDIYSLGVVMYQMLTGELPLQADNDNEMMIAHARTPPRPIERTPHGAEVPDAIGALVMRCLEKDPAQRPPNARALIEEIEYWEEEPARRDREAEQERMAREQAEAKRAELERLARETAEAAAKLKAERELQAAKETELQRTELYGEGDHPFPGSASGPAEVLGDGTGAGGAEVWRAEPPRPHDAAPPEVPPALTPVATASAEAASAREQIAPGHGRSRRGLAIAAVAVGALLLGSAVWFLRRGSTRVTNQASHQVSSPRSVSPTGGNETTQENPGFTPTVSPKEEQGITNQPSHQVSTPANALPTADKETRPGNPVFTGPAASPKEEQRKTNQARYQASTHPGASARGGNETRPENFVRATPVPSSEERTSSSMKAEAEVGPELPRSAAPQPSHQRPIDLPSAPQRRPAAPACKLTAPETIVRGESGWLAWTSTNATDLDLQPGLGKQQTTGSISIMPTESTTYRMSAIGPGGNTVCTAQVFVALLPKQTSGLFGRKRKVVPPPPPPQPPPAFPACSLVTEPDTIDKGQSATLAWTSANATDLDLQPSLGKQQAAGSTSISPSDSTTYTLSATGPGGDTTCQARVVVTPPPPPLPPPVPPRGPTEEEFFSEKIRNAYFDLGRSNIGPDAEENLRFDADFLKAHPDIKFTIAGNAAEREGTEEQTLRLGYRRAAAAKKFLVSLGITADRISTISYGKDRPVCTDHDETCWQKNRNATPVFGAISGAK
ncbi:MAG: protein kinase domain-containing protein [Terriglobia bacterium]